MADWSWPAKSPASRQQGTAMNSCVASAYLDQSVDKTMVPDTPVKAKSTRPPPVRTGPPVQFDPAHSENSFVRHTMKVASLARRIWELALSRHLLRRPWHWKKARGRCVRMNT